MYKLHHSMTVPGNVTGVMLTCEVVELINQCTVDWDVSGCATSSSYSFIQCTYLYITLIFIYVHYVHKHFLAARIRIYVHKIMHVCICMHVRT